MNRHHFLVYLKARYHAHRSLNDYQGNKNHKSVKCQEEKERNSQGLIYLLLLVFRFYTVHFLVELQSQVIAITRTLNQDQYKYHN